jgi:hypothetical protein
MIGQEGKNFEFRDTHILLAGAQPYAPDPILGLPEGISCESGSAE